MELVSGHLNQPWGEACLPSFPPAPQSPQDPSALGQTSSMPPFLSILPGVSTL